MWHYACVEQVSPHPVHQREMSCVKSVLCIEKEYTCSRILMAYLTVCDMLGS